MVNRAKEILQMPYPCPEEHTDQGHSRCEKQAADQRLVHIEHSRHGKHSMGTQWRGLQCLVLLEKD